jgi:transposase
MWRSLLTSLVRPKKVTFAWGNGTCPLRSQRPGSSYARWTADEDRKLVELRQQGLEFSQVANMMSNRSLVAIINRFGKVKPGSVTPQSRSKATPRLWSPQEEALLLEMVQQGVSHHDMANRLPGRSYPSIKCHLANRETWTSGQRQKHRTYTDAELQRMIHMRLKEARSFKEIALEFNCSQQSVTEVWRARCLRLIPEEAQELIKMHRLWSQKETDHLIKLHRKGTLSTRDVALQFPSKSLTHVRQKCLRELLVFPRCTKKPY